MPVTLNRLELSRAEPSRYHRISHDTDALEALLVDLFLDAHRKPPAQITLDLDATDDPLHGHQEGRFFHGYYDGYCSLPLYVFCGRHLLAAIASWRSVCEAAGGGATGGLRRSNIDASAGAVEEIARIVAQMRKRWPRVRVLLRADSGFAREGLMVWCEANRVDYLFGLARNARLEAESAAELDQAREESMATGKPARRFRDFAWRTRDTWSRERRVIGKAEWTGDKANPRFVVTSLGAEAAAAQPLYEAIYCARGEMENRIKECQLDLFADRTYCEAIPRRDVSEADRGGDHAGQPAAPVVRLHGLRAGLRAAPDRPRPHRVRSRDLRHHPAQAAQDRRAGADQRAAREARHGLGLPVAIRVRTRPCPIAQRRHRLTRTKHVITIALDSAASPRRERTRVEMAPQAPRRNAMARPAAKPPSKHASHGDAVRYAG